MWDLHLLIVLSRNVVCLETWTTNEEAPSFIAMSSSITSHLYKAVDKMVSSSKYKVKYHTCLLKKTWLVHVRLHIPGYYNKKIQCMVYLEQWLIEINWFCFMVFEILLLSSIVAHYLQSSSVMVIWLVLGVPAKTQPAPVTVRSILNISEVS